MTIIQSNDKTNDSNTSNDTSKLPPLGGTTCLALPVYISIYIYIYKYV